MKHVSILYSILLFFIYLNEHIISAQICNHIPPRVEEISFVNLQSERTINKRSADHNLRIFVHYDKSVHELPDDKFTIINMTVLPQALDFWQKALKVRPLRVPIKLSRKCPDNKIFFPPSIKPFHQHCIEQCLNITTCGEVVVPQDHLDVCRVCNRQGMECREDRKQLSGEGVIGSDFVLYVSAIQTDRCEKGATVAYASHCQQESQFDRPIAGHANLCPKSISTKRQDLDTLSSTIKHEIVHALGFSISLYAYFRDPDGNPLTPREQDSRPKLDEKLHIPQWSDKVVKTIKRKNWLVRSGYITKDVHMFVTPRVVEEVRKHFNCTELEGAELEDQGEDGTTLTHWEKRVFENEAMTGTHTQNPVYSRITLALLEDTGWYYPNYEMAQPLKWGMNLGCNFAMKSCKEWIDRKRKLRQSIQPFCEKVKREPLETECTDYRDAVALCNLKRYPDKLPKEYQNFDHIKGVESPSELEYYGGSVSLADYCPYIQEFTWRAKDVVVRGSQCQFVENNPSSDKNFALEYYGPDSKCFNHKDKWKERTCYQSRHWQHWGSGCYQYQCLDGRVNLIIANSSYTCYFPNDEIKVQRYVDGWLHIGTILCPSCREICPDMKCRDESPTKVIFSPEGQIDELKCFSMVQVSSDMLIVCSFLISLYNVLAN